MNFCLANSMDIDIIPCSFRSSLALIDMPENIWLDIFSYLSLKEKFTTAGTCRTWHRILADPSLYTHISLDFMEFDTLVLCMQQLCRLAPRIRSLRIANCHSSFISKTTVPVQNTSIMHHFPQHQGMHTLHTHITSFTLPRRREEYRKLGFTLHQDFSRALAILMEQSHESLKSLNIQDNFLDLEMTELVFCISFQGQHAISDTVLRRMMSGWEELKSITLAPYQAPSVGTKEVSMEGLWSLLECGKVESLELLDLECISNDNVRTMMERVKKLQATSFERVASSPLSHPFAHHHSYFATAPPSTSSTPLPGSSVRHLTITKYTSTPLTLPGFGALLKLFPNLESFKFTTNFFTYDHHFQGLTRNIYEEEIVMVERMIRSEMLGRWGATRGVAATAACWEGEWNASVTEDQRLRASILRSV
ncbi:hypothetical protein BGZ96_007042 [Linnemannia gamsii]|uniref:F-box domain-containing protein n=1 Tax=Linnemannia gamsii TaxID=64522 RepID=A0ABQ7KE57_9FUNG|nr:hypothetical protein BGZ96_007042 [Linnemannia gamsii]